jgi:hypothetical protein
MNHHDQWTQFRDANRAGFAETGLSEKVWASEVRLGRFLNDGTVEGDLADITRLNDEQFLRLEQLVNVFYPDEQHQAGFTALGKERLRRFGRYGW